MSSDQAASLGFLARHGAAALGLIVAVALAAGAAAPASAQGRGERVRFATFNASLNRAAEGELVADLSAPDDPQAAAVAEIIQRTRPDVLLINESDFDAQGQALELFQRNYLSRSQRGAVPIHYDHRFTAPSNTGVPVRPRPRRQRLGRRSQ